MRVVAGKYKGRKLLEFSGKDIRPTSDMVRESLFNILQFDVQDSAFLDLFCGTGAVGIEALSRGAKTVTFNDLDRRSIELTTQNLKKIGAEQDAIISRADAVNFLQTTAQKFHLVFIDAPYASPSGAESLKFVHKVLYPNAIVVYENEKPFDGEAQGLVKTGERKYGRAYLTFFKGE